MNDDVIYALIIVAEDNVYAVEKVLGDIKESFGLPRGATIHCREIFHEDARKKSDFKKISYEDIWKLLHIISLKISEFKLGTIIGHANRKTFNSQINADQKISNIKQLIPYAYIVAAAQLEMDPKYKGKCTIIADPFKDKIAMMGKDKSQHNAFKYSEIDLRLKTILPIENLEIAKFENKPVILELSDILAYCGARVIANSNAGSPDFRKRIKLLYRDFHAVVRKYRPANPEESIEGILENYEIIRRK